MSLGSMRGPRLLWPLDQHLPPWLVVAAGSLEESQISSSLPYQSREDSQAPGETWMLKLTGENKDEVEDAQRQCSPTGTVDAS